MFTYPVVVHWAWSGGWFAKLGSQSDASGAGYMDFAGSGVVHMFGGFNALVGSIIVGPRTKRGVFFCEEGGSSLFWSTDYTI